MSPAWIIFALLHSISLLFTAVVVMRLLRYSRRYVMEESRYTLLFGFITVRSVIVVYVISMALWVLVSYLLVSRI